MSDEIREAYRRDMKRIRKEIVVEIIVAVAAYILFASVLCLIVIYFVG